METAKNKDIFKKLYTLFAEGKAHGKGNQKAKEKPDEGKFKTDLPQQIESGGGIIPYAQMQNAIDENTDEKFCRDHEGGADQTAKEKGNALQFPIDKRDGREADATRYDHGNMRISSPKYLEQAVSDAAREHTDGAVFPFTPGMRPSKGDFR